MRLGQPARQGRAQGALRARGPAAARSRTRARSQGRQARRKGRSVDHHGGATRRRRDEHAPERRRQVTHSKLGLASWLIAGAMCCSLVGCKALFKKRQTDTAPSAIAITPTPVTEIAPVASASASAAPVATAPVVDEASIPAPQDFEDEA